MSNFLTLILAAGEGTRMRSGQPKVLHRVGGLAMLGHVIRAAQAAGSSRLAAVIGPNHDAVRREVAGLSPQASIFVQAERLGTGHAVRMAETAFAEEQGGVIVLYGDNPLVSDKTIRAVVGRLEDGADLVVVGFEPQNPTGYGRLLTEGGRLLAIREEKDASEAERSVGLCNSGIMGFRAETLRRLIGRIGNSNAKGEYYLTDAVELANADRARVEYTIADADEVVGVNDRAQLARAEALFQDVRREDMMARGVTLHDPSSVYFSWDTEIAEDVVIEPHVVFGPGAKVERNAVIHAFSHIEGAHVGAGVSIGPFARLRPGADVAEGAKVGNFVEIKAARIGAGAKVNHLTYVGDAEVGAGANLGAGTVTCNYDGVNKAKTIIGAGAFIGSNASLVAPVAIGDDAYVGSGSVITEDVEPGALALGRARQVTKPGRAKAMKEKALALKAARTGTV